MVSKDESGDGTAKLERQISCIKYTLFCFNVVSWMVGAALFGLTIWLRADPGFQEWVSLLRIEAYNIGVYILIGASIIVMVVSFLGCCSALMEHTQALWLYIGSQILGFIIGTVGAAVLLDFSTINSSLQPILHDTLRRFIMQSEYEPSQRTLNMIQENIGCCGAAGSNDYMILRQPLPASCRDTVTGNAFFYGCTDELTWLVEDKSGWIAGLAMAGSLINIINAVMSLVLIQALKKEEEEARTYRH